MAKFVTKYRLEDWQGKRFGHLEIIGKDSGVFICKCDCGNVVSVKPAYLFNRKKSTCGNNCKIHLEKNSGKTYTRLYRIWISMKSRCYNKNNDSYFRYGGRGICICDEWRNNFDAFRSWAEHHGYQDALTIDRIDTNGNYEPSNCRWATYQEQRENQNSRYTFTDQHYYGKLYAAFGEEKPLSEWCSIYGLSRPMITARLKTGLSLEEALTLPKHSEDFYTK